MLWLIVPVVLIGLILWFLRGGRSFGEAVQYIVFLRYPLGLAFILFCFPSISRSEALEKYLGNLLVVDGRWQLFLVTLFAILATVPLILAIELILRYGPARFNVSTPEDWMVSNRYFVWFTGRCKDRNRQVGFFHMLRFVFGLLTSVPIVYVVTKLYISGENRDQTPAPLWQVALVIIAAYAIAACGIRMALYFRNLAVDSPPVVDIVYLYLDFPLWFLNKLEHRYLKERKIHPQQPNINVNQPAAAGAPAPGQVNRAENVYQPHALSGYRPHDPNMDWRPWLRRWYPGHISGLVLFIGCAISFIWAISRSDPWHDPKGSFPSLGFVLLLLAVCGWLLPAAAFFFDRWRLPVPALLVLIWAVIASFLSADHYYNVSDYPEKTSQVVKASNEAAPEVKTDDPLTATQATLKWLGPKDIHPATEDEKGAGSKEVAIVVLAAGGGIVASAWTAEVLTALESTFGGKFTGRILAISSVSGGSVGTMYYMIDFNRGAQRNSQSLASITKAAESSSLSATAWGVVARDFWRFAYPWEQDRATALEQAWKNSWESATVKMWNWPKLRDWRSRIRNGRFPIVFFNTTSVESGSPYLFTPIDIKPSSTTPAANPDVSDRPTAFRNHNNGQRPPPPPFDGFGNFVEDYPLHDVECVTSARLSATFPWVTPVACAAPVGPKEPTTHLADGGYFDNFGITTIVEFLFATGPTLQDNNIHKIIVIDISAWSRGSAKAVAIRDSALGQLFRQAPAPIATLYKARGTSQSGRAASEIHLLQDALPNDVELLHFPMYMDEYVGTNDFHVPMSWHLDAREQDVFRKAHENMQKVSQPTANAGHLEQPPSDKGNIGINESKLRDDWSRLRALIEPPPKTEPAN
jgi:hypothetical protein